MSDDLEIVHGGAVAVDTASLHAVAASLVEVGAEFEEALGMARDAHVLLEEAMASGGAVPAIRAADRVRTLLVDLERERERVRELGIDLLTAAFVYEYAELAARRDAATDPAVRAAFDAQLERLRAAAPGVETLAGMAAAGHTFRGPWEIVSQAFAGGGGFGIGMSSVLSATALLGAAFVRGFGAGTVPADSRLTGTAPPVTVNVVSRGVATPVASVAEAARRVPREGSIRIEKYTMPNGTARFVTYVAGMASGPLFDMDSNIKLYSGQVSTSYEAVRQALERSGAEPGDVVDGVGHSQGAMILERVALEGEYTTETDITFGAPVRADVSASTLVVDVRHDDDPVSALADGGTGFGVGSADSFVATRTSAPGPGVGDLVLSAHQMTAYTDTAEILDASSDPRMGAVRAYFDELAQATSVEVTVYDAELQPVFSGSSSAVDGG